MRAVGQCWTCDGPRYPDVDREGYSVERCGRCGETVRLVRRAPTEEDRPGRKPWSGRGQGGRKRPVVDPFGGAGTTGLVADRLGRDALLIELNPAYAALASERYKADAPLFALSSESGNG